MPARQVVIQDPYHPYSEYLIDLLRRRYGLRTICFYTNALGRRVRARRFPILFSDSIEANYAVRPDQIAQLAEVLRQRHDVAAVIPVVEPGLGPASQIADLLGLSWAQPAVLARFRDKHALKEHLRATPGGPRVNAFQLVSNADDVAGFVEVSGVGRFVIKPCGGYGNSRVGIFDATASRQQVASFLSTFGGRPVLAEEYLAGEEFFVNGQVDAEGGISVLAVFSTVRVSVNGRQSLHTEYRKIDHGDPRFRTLSGYVKHVVAATGLRRSPFHAEVIIDNRGPCLVEIAARLCGANNAFEMNRLHGGALDVLDIAAHYYLTGAGYGAPPVDWVAYDRSAFRQVLGVSTVHGCIFELDGLAEVKSMPQFAGWVQRPHVSQHLAPTVDLFTSPWQVELAGGSESDLDRATTRVRSAIGWNDRSTGLRKIVLRALAYARLFGRYRYVAYPSPAHPRRLPGRRFARVSSSRRP